MSEEKITPCECPMAGYCSRHKINKPAHFHNLCKTRPDYFAMYENCAGPGQEFTNCKDDDIVNAIVVTEEFQDPIQKIPMIKKETSKPEKPKQMKGDDIKVPSLWEQAKSFAKASQKHISSGLAKVTQEEQKERLSICQSCVWFKERENRCGHCGCPLAKKTLWKTSTCPINKWKAIE